VTPFRPQRPEDLQTLGAFLASPLDWQLDCVVVLGALLSSIHLLTLALGLGAIFIRGRALAQPLDEVGWQRLLAADNIWGVAAGLWIASGLGRVFLGGKEPGFYWHNGFFWVKLALFGLVFALELTPMMTFIRVRAARRRSAALPRFSVEACRRINSAEVVLVVAIVFVASFMARGAWLF
jgi:putative membrane protein